MFECPDMYKQGMFKEQETQHMAGMKRPKRSVA